MKAGETVSPNTVPDQRRRIATDISVVIPTVGRQMLRQCLASIAAGQLLPHSIVVVDQSSNEAIRGWLDTLAELGVEARYQPSSQTGRAAGVNRGVESVTSEYVAITDDDCQVAPDWLLNLRKHLETNPGAVITGRVESGGEQTVGIVVTSMEEVHYRRPRLKFDSLCGGNMATSRSVFRRVGLLDEDAALACSEDGEWAYRALRNGVSIVYVPDAIITHHGWRNRDKRVEQYRAYALSHGAFYGKYLRRADWFIALRAVVHYLRALRRLLKGILSGSVEEVRIARAYLVWLIPGAIKGFRSRAGLITGRSGNAC